MSTLTVLTGAAGDLELSAALSTIFTSQAAALSFLTFTILYMPCVAAFAASKRELGSLKSAIGAAAFQTGMAYVTAILVYFVANLWM